MMKIAFFYRQLNQGGIQRMIVNCVNYFTEQGYDVSLILIKPGGEYHELLNKGVKIIYFKSLKQVTLIPTLIDILRKEKFDLLYTATPDLNTFTILAKLFSGLKTKIVISERNNTTVFFKHMKMSLSKLTFLTIPFLYRFADGIVAVSRGVKDNLIKVALLPEEKITVIYNPAYSPQLDEQMKVHVEHPWFDDPAVPVVVTVGRLAAAKNHMLLIDAVAVVARNRPVRLIIIGEGPLKEELERKIIGGGLEHMVCLTGFQLNPVAWVKRADVFALSSDYEGFGNVLVEALAAGTTIVSTDCNYGPGEILAPDYGYLVPVGDTLAMAEQIGHALDFPVAEARLKERAKEFSLERIMLQYRQLFAN